MDIIYIYINILLSILYFSLEIIDISQPNLRSYQIGSKLVVLIFNLDLGIAKKYLKIATLSRR